MRGTSSLSGDGPPDARGKHDPASLRHGVGSPRFDSEFELFDMEADPGETTNLAAAEPERFRERIRLWREQRRKLGIILPSDL